MGKLNLRLLLIGTGLAASLVCAGCADGFTVHSIIDEPAAPVPPHDRYGLWVQKTGATNYRVLRIAPVSVPDRACEVAEIRVWEEPASLADAPLLEGRACLSELSGHTVVEISTLTAPVLYLHYLVRLEPTRISSCGLQTVWGLFRDLADDEPPRVTLDGLEYTTREWDEYEQMFLISEGTKLRAYLDKHLPTLAEICDAHDSWETLERVTPRPASDPDAVDSASGKDSLTAREQ